MFKETEDKIKMGFDVPDDLWKGKPKVLVRNHHKYLINWIKHADFAMLESVTFAPDPTPFNEAQLYPGMIDMGFTHTTLWVLERHGMQFKKCKIYNKLCNVKILGELGT